MTADSLSRTTEGDLLSALPLITYAQAKKTGDTDTLATAKTLADAISKMVFKKQGR